jgi:2-polyprenyl-3-methyl-5-hydroxy-6-metoxy-1,4-benzoquinol methylase
MSYSEFLKEITSDHQYLNEEAIAYARYHGRRLYITYKYCIKYLKKGDKVLSIGAGIGSVEKMLAAWGAEVTVVDFEAGIEPLQEYYDHLGIKTCAANLYKDPLTLPPDYFNLLLCSEVIEHVPMAPQQQLVNIRPYLHSGAAVIITTPNLGSILHIARLLVMRPILEVPEKTFGEVNAENQAVHRREYLPSEIRYAFRKAGLEPVTTRYFFYTNKLSFSLLILFVFGSIIPRFRPGMLLVAKKK